MTSKFSEASEKLSSSFADLRSRFTPPAKASIRACVVETRASMGLIQTSDLTSSVMVLQAEEEVAKPAARAARAEAKKRAAEAEQTVKVWSC